jgi:ferritin-like metal-binding protein YciE
MPAQQKTLADAFHETLKDVLFAERQSVRGLAKAAKAAQAPELKEAFETHREESSGQIERLTRVFEIVGKPARGKTCEALQGLTAEMEEQLEEFQGSPAADAVLIAAAQAIEHYEIARYGTLKAWALQLGLEEAAELLGETLDEEKRTDELLTRLAEEISNAEAEAGEEVGEAGERKGSSRKASRPSGAESRIKASNSNGAKAPAGKRSEGKQSEGRSSGGKPAGKSEGKSEGKSAGAARAGAQGGAKPAKARS